jgi:hypothetical protein
MGRTKEDLVTFANLKFENFKPPKEVLQMID